MVKKLKPYEDLLERADVNICDIVTSIKDYSWNDPRTKLSGHHFTAPNGWLIETNPLLRGTNWIGEAVFAYPSKEKEYQIARCVYMASKDKVYFDYIKPLKEYAIKFTNCPEEQAVAAAEYLYLMYHCPKRVRKK